MLKIKKREILVMTSHSARELGPGLYERDDVRFG